MPFSIPPSQPPHPPPPTAGIVMIEGKSPWHTHFVGTPHKQGDSLLPLSGIN